MSTKIVINTEIGGFHLTSKMKVRMAELMGKEIYFFTLEGSDSIEHTPGTFDADWAVYVLYTKDFEEYRKASEEFDKIRMDFEGSIEERRKLYEDFNKKYCFPCDSEIDRTDPFLIQVVEEFKNSSPLRVVEIPDDCKDWYIHEAEDGTESIHEKHRFWNYQNKE